MVAELIEKWSLACTDVWRACAGIEKPAGSKKSSILFNFLCHPWGKMLGLLVRCSGRVSGPVFNHRLLDIGYNIGDL
jgi:hypothetical protein